MGADQSYPLAMTLGAGAYFIVLDKLVSRNFSLFIQPHPLPPVQAEPSPQTPNPKLTAFSGPVVLVHRAAHFGGRERSGGAAMRGALSGNRRR